MATHAEHDPPEQLTPGEMIQQQRKHIFCINESGILLGQLRELLQAELFNVTATNFVPQTFAQLQAANVDLLIIAVETMHESAWLLLAEIEANRETQHIPTIILAADPAALDKTNEIVSGYHGPFEVLSDPRDTNRLLAAVHALIGSA